MGKVENKEEITGILHFWDESHIYDDNKALAKEVTDLETNKTKYFVKVGDNYLCNPSKFVNDQFWKERTPWTFRSVSKQCYDMYVLFVKTRREIYLRDAQRVYQPR